MSSPLAPLIVFEGAGGAPIASVVLSVSELATYAASYTDYLHRAWDLICEEQLLLHMSPTLTERPTNNKIGIDSFVENLIHYGNREKLDAQLTLNAINSISKELFQQADQGQHGSSQGPQFGALVGYYPDLSYPALYSHLYKEGGLFSSTEDPFSYFPSVGGRVTARLLNEEELIGDLHAPVLRSVGQFLNRVKHQSGTTFTDWYKAVLAEDYSGWCIDGEPQTVNAQYADVTKIKSLEVMEGDVFHASAVGYVIIQIVRQIWKNASSFPGGLDKLSALISSAKPLAGNEAILKIIMMGLVDAMVEIQSSKTIEHQGWQDALAKVTSQDDNNPLPPLIDAFNRVAAAVSSQSAKGVSAQDMGAKTYEHVVSLMERPLKSPIKGTSAVVLPSGEVVLGSQKESQSALVYLDQQRATFNAGGKALLAALWAVLGPQNTHVNK